MSQTAIEAQSALCQLSWIEEGGNENPRRIKIIEDALNRLTEYERALSALTQGGVKVKELEWVQLYEKHTMHPKEWHGTGIFDARYIIKQRSRDSEFFVVGKNHKTLEAAKSAAQADYETRIRSALSTQEPIMEKLGRFGHHPDPANDFCIEVEAIVGLHFDALHGISKPGTEPITMAEVQQRIDSAMDFTVGGDEIAVKAKATLRTLSTTLQKPVGEISVLPCDVTVGSTIFRKGVNFGIFVRALQRLAPLAHQPVTAGLEKADDEAHLCPICAVPFRLKDICATDITEGVCHYACLEGSPTVDLITGEPTEGPIAKYRYDSLVEPAALKSEGRKRERVDISKEGRTIPNDSITGLTEGRK